MAGTDVTRQPGVDTPAARESPRMTDSDPDVGKSPDSDLEEHRIRGVVASRLFGEPVQMRQLGRYLILERLGSGGLGLVYAAFDPDLERRVAIKVLHGATTQTDADRDRLVDEARTLARLSHPNIVPIHDVGLAGEQVFIAMELVRGRTLRAWLRQRERPIARVLEVFVQAGRGLEAAHENGVVHRDFKPDNAILGDDGRVRVLDFGLAGTLGSAGEPQAGAPLGGTPAYMAPEQFEGAPGPRGDQFSFCVALYEALFGSRPYPGDSVPAIVAALGEGTPRPPPRSTTPAAVRRAVMRGLAVEPSERFDSMTDLLLELEPARARPRRYVLAGAALAAGLAAWTVARADQACPDPTPEIDAVWNDEAQAVLADSPLSEEVSEHLDAFASRWVAARSDACESTRRGEQSPQLLDLRIACLDRTLRRVAAVLGELRSTTADAVALARSADIRRCEDTESLLGTPTRSLSGEVEDKLAQAYAVSVLGRAGKEIELLAAAQESLPDDASPPDKAWIAIRRGRALANTARSDEATAVLDAGLAGAERDRASPATRATLLIELAGSVAGSGRGLEAERLAKLAIAAMEGTPSAKVQLPAALAVLGSAARVQGQHDVAFRRFTAAVAALDDVPPVQPNTQLGSKIRALDRARLLGALGIASRGAGDLEAAASHHQQAISLLEDAFDRHPELAYALSNYSAVLSDQGAHGESLRALERAAEILADEPAQRRRLAVVKLNIGATLLSAGRHDAAAAALTEAVRELEATGEPDARLASAVYHLGLAHFFKKDFANALRAFGRAAEVQRAVYGDGTAPVVTTLSATGDALAALGRIDEARSAFQSALRDDAAPGLDPIVRGEARLGLAKVLEADAARVAELAGQAQEFFERAGSEELAAEARRLKEGTRAGDTD